MTENWRPVSINPERYSVSDMGRVRDDLKRRLLRLTLQRYGYLIVGIRVDESRKHVTKLVHCLVADAFIGPRPEGMDVCHWNGDKTDNRVSNLRYDTRRNNEADKIRHGTRLRGLKHPQSYSLGMIGRALDLLRHGLSVRKTAKWLAIDRGALSKYL